MHGLRKAFVEHKMALLPLQEQAIASPQVGAKRPAASLLPAFEPFSSSPALPRLLKRTRDVFDEKLQYPTPVPTSSTAILSSSPPRGLSRPFIQRSISTLSERAPLSAVPTIELNPDGSVISLGRSSASCSYQLSSNRLISRVHVQACYKPATSRLERDRVEITCCGWNGVKIHCRGKVYELKKGETFSSDIREAEIMLDVHDSRAVIQWPEKPHLGPISSDEEDGLTSPTKKQRAMRRHSTPPSPSPLQSRRRPVSPISPSPAVIQALLPSSPPLLPSLAPIEEVEIYEDPEPLTKDEISDERPVDVSLTTQAMSQTGEPQAESQASSLSSSVEFSDNDEENDPIIHSFGPFGANILPRMASFNTADSPRVNNALKSSRSSRTEPLQPNRSPCQPAVQSSNFDVRDHVINQLAYSRLSSTPLSTILSHLPRDAGSVSKATLRQVIQETDCIGEVAREGKDAAGKPLESEFYYIPDKDKDDKRKEAVVNDLMKPGLRACRKQHKVSPHTLNHVLMPANTSKQYFWRKPK